MSSNELYLIRKELNKTKALVDLFKSNAFENFVKEYTQEHLDQTMQRRINCLNEFEYNQLTQEIDAVPFLKKYISRVNAHYEALQQSEALATHTD